jgi:hypothetical protein
VMPPMAVIVPHSRLLPGLGESGNRTAPIIE